MMAAQYILFWQQEQIIQTLTESVVVVFCTFNIFTRKGRLNDEKIRILLDKPRNRVSSYFHSSFR